LNRRSVILVVAICAGVGLVPALITANGIGRISGHFGQQLIPDSRAYLVLIDVRGTAPALKTTPELLSVRVLGGLVEPLPEYPEEVVTESNGLGWTAEVRCSDRMCFEYNQDGQRRQSATLDGGLVKRALVSVGAPDSDHISDEAAELAALLSAICREGWAAVSFGDAKGGGRAIGRLHHFDGYGDGSSGFRFIPRGYFLAWWTGLTALLLVPTGIWRGYRRHGRPAVPHTLR